MTDDYGMGTTMGIIGAGVSLYALKGVVDMVNGPRRSNGNFCDSCGKQSNNLRATQNGFSRAYLCPKCYNRGNSRGQGYRRPGLFGW